MADGPDVSEILRRTVQANARLYKGWVDLSVEYWRGIGEIFGVTPPSSGEEAEREENTGGLLVLEAPAGSTARGAFLVTNDLGRNVRCELVASELSGPRGVKLPVQVNFDPPSLELAPGQQHVVAALVAVEDRLTPGAAYGGTLSIRGMDDFSVPFVLRRMHSMEEAERAAARPAEAAAGRPSGAAPDAAKHAAAGGGTPPPPATGKGRSKGDVKAPRPGKKRQGKAGQ
jgi:hypothetical protein